MNQIACHWEHNDAVCSPKTQERLCCKYYLPDNAGDCAHLHFRLYCACRNRHAYFEAFTIALRKQKGSNNG